MTHDRTVPDRRLGVVVRRRRLYVDATDLAGMFRARAALYRQRADELTLAEASPRELVLADGDRIVPPLEEALACRMVAEELEQRADALDAL